MSISQRSCGVKEFSLDMLRPSYDSANIYIAYSREYTYVHTKAPKRGNVSAMELLSVCWVRQSNIIRHHHYASNFWFSPRCILLHKWRTRILRLVMCSMYTSEAAQIIRQLGNRLMQQILISPLDMAASSCSLSQFKMSCMEVFWNFELISSDKKASCLGGIHSFIHSFMTLR